MVKITYKDIYTPGIIIFENEQYIHVHDSKMLLRYDSNFLEFKRMPSVEQFKEAAEYLKAFHENKGQKHVKFYFPENELLSAELTSYLEEAEFIVGFTELYTIQPHCFPSIEENEDIKIEVVTEKNLDAYLNLQYEQDRIYGDDFADQKIEMNKSNFKDKNIVQLLAIYIGIPAGAVDVILTEGKAIAEIDGIFVMEEYQKRGIASQLQKFVMKKFADKQIFLLADGDDTPREMYQKQNYQFLGLQYQALDSWV